MAGETQRARIRKLYGFDFPDDLFAAWDLAERSSPHRPLRPFQPPGDHFYELLDLTLVGPFHLLAGEFDERVRQARSNEVDRSPAAPMALHWRHFMDPPEFFTCAKGNVDGLLWGYWFDDPTRLEPWFTSYYTNDAFELGPPVGRTFFDAVRSDIEDVWNGLEETAEAEEDERLDDSSRDELFDWLDKLRDLVMEYGTGDRREIGEAYTDLYAPYLSQRDPTISTFEKMGVVVPAGTLRPLSRSGEELRRALRDGAAVGALIEEAQVALRDGFPGTALAFGRELWAFGSRYQDPAFELLIQAYYALERPILAEVATAHRRYRSQSVVDIRSW